MPVPLHHMLPLDKQRMPMIKGPFTFIVTSRGCPAGCKFCIKHVSYQTSVRIRSPQLILEELKVLSDLGIHNVHMYADLFTVNRQQVVDLCNLILESGLKVKWTCNSRVDYVDEEMLKLMGKAGCWYISWGIESANELILKRIRKGYHKEQAFKALKWSKAAGINNWGYFIIGLPGETEESIQETIAYAKELPLDIALFHIAAPYPGTPFFYEVVENGWFRPGTNWEEVDMDQSTVLDYADLHAERLEYWQKRATCEWSLRPGPMLTFVKGMNTWEGFKSAMGVGWHGVRFAQSIVWTALAYNPVRPLGLFGLAAIAVTLLVGIWLVAQRLQGVTSLSALGIFAVFTAVVLGVVGVSLFTLGAMFNYLVSLFYHQPIRQGLFGKPIFKTPLDRHFWWMGLIGFFTGFARARR